MAGIPVFATDPEIACVGRLRRALADAGTSYAMLVGPEQRFRNLRADLDSMLAADDPLAAYTAETRFAIVSPQVGADAPVIEVGDLIVEQNFSAIPEALVKIDGETYVVARPSPWPHAPALIEAASRLARAARELAGRPLARRYRCCEFHHPNDSSWQTLLMVVSLAETAVPL